jgi:hypothetical protein
MRSRAASRPPPVDPLQDELRLLDRHVDEGLLREVRLVRVHRVDDLPRAQERRGEQDRVLALFLPEIT